MKTVKKTQTKTITIMELFTPDLNPLKCNKCGRCIEVCPKNVFSVDEDDNFIVSNVEKCNECGACVLNCPKKALSFETVTDSDCIWDTTFQRLKTIAFWNISKPKSTESLFSTK